MSTVINGSTGINKVQDGSIQPEDLAQKMTLMEAQTASGTFVDFTGIPSWAKRITVMFNGVSTNGTSTPRIQLGSGVISSSGYNSCGTVISATSVAATTNSTAGFILGAGGAAADIRNGNITLALADSDVWTISGCLGYSSGAVTCFFAGSKTLSGTLDRVRITTVNGTDVFDAGTINIMYEG